VVVDHFSVRWLIGSFHISIPGSCPFGSQSLLLYHITLNCQA
jgi:hypothetical protein